ncbi:hypothetical protein B4088_3461 [Bacillus cereus]|uniref:Uncharacterized protein n=1 Tax=Bacillus cereus TaxID=1396 RepID=A0A164N6X9_BACCE|nr:hypothetical protein B4088_3461 [Bacillus cereus]
MVLFVDLFFVLVCTVRGSGVIKKLLLYKPLTFGNRKLSKNVDF